MRKLIDVSEAAKALVLDPNTPLLGYVVKSETLRKSPELVAGLANTSRAAKAILAMDDAEWTRIRDRMNAKTDAQFDALKSGFLAGIPSSEPIDQTAAAKMLELMASIGGPDLMGSATKLSEGTFFELGN